MRITALVVCVLLCACGSGGAPEALSLPPVGAPSPVAPAPDVPAAPPPDEGGNVSPGDCEWWQRDVTDHCRAKPNPTIGAIEVG